MKEVVKIVSYLDDDYKNIANPKNSAYNNHWYLHGLLEEVLHYDKASIYNVQEIPHDIEQSSPTHKFYSSRLEGVYPVKLYNYNRPCIGYFWYDIKEVCWHQGDNKPSYKAFFTEQYGYIVDAEDEDAKRFAYNKMKNRVKRL